MGACLAACQVVSYCAVMTQREWSEELAAVVAGEVRRYRKAQGMSAQALADACAELGMSIQRSVIANFENGRRNSIGLAELLVFAAALKVPPISLIFPCGYLEEMRPLPQTSWDPYRGAKWFSGEALITRWPVEANPIRLSRNLTDLLVKLGEARMELSSVSETKNLERELGMTKRLRDAARVEYDLAVEAERDAAMHHSALLDYDDEESRQRAQDAAERARHARMLAMERRAEIAEVEERVLNLEKELRLASVVERRISRLEGQVVELLLQFKKSGWLPPRIPDASAHLAEIAERISNERIARAEVNDEPEGDDS